MVLLILYLRNIYIFWSQITHAYIYNQCSSTVITYGKALYINDSIPDKTLTLRKSMYMRASRASELRKFSHFYILKLLYLSIFCRYFGYFVGTNDMLVGLHVPTNFQMYRQNSEKAFIGGGGGQLPPPPLATLMFWLYSHLRVDHFLKSYLFEIQLRILFDADLS